MKKQTREEAKIHIYVSPDGSDNNSGKIEEPLSTISAAIKASRGQNAPVTVSIFPGRYFINSTLEITEADSNLTIEAYDNGDVYLDGGVIISPDDVRPISPETAERIIDRTAVGHIVEVDLRPYRTKRGIYGTRGFRRSYQNAPNELFVNGKPYSVTSYPKYGTPPLNLTDEMIVSSGSSPYNGEFDMRPGIIRAFTDRLRKWEYADDAYLTGYFGSSYADDTVKISDIDTDEKTITTALPHLFSFSGGDGHNIRVINLLEEMSQPGEYFIDTENEILYFYPDSDISSSLIQLSSFDRVIMSIENAKNVTVSGITFENSRNSGIYIEGGAGVKIENCTFRNLGILGIQIGCGATPMPEGRHTAHGVRASDVPTPVNFSRNMGSWHEYLYEFAAWNNNGGKNHLIRNCVFCDTGAGGILLSGGDRKTLTPGGNTVDNCTFFRNNRLNRTYCGAVNIMGVGNSVVHCDISELPSVAVYLHGNDHNISYNKIHNVVKEVSDMGAVYMGRDCTEVGNKIHHNFFYDIATDYESGWGISAIYIDDNAIYNAVYSNFFYRVISNGKANFSVIQFNKGGMTSVCNNFFIDCNCNCIPKVPDNGYTVMHTDPLFISRCRTGSPEDFHGVDILSSAWRKAYPYLAETYKKNYNAGCLYYNNHFMNGNGYNMFENVGNLDFRLTGNAAENLRNKKSDAEINDPVMGIENTRVPYSVPDFENIGTVKSGISSNERQNG